MRLIQEYKNELARERAVIDAYFSERSVKYNDIFFRCRLKMKWDAFKHALSNTFLHPERRETSDFLKCRYRTYEPFETTEHWLCGGGEDVKVR